MKLCLFSYQGPAFVGITKIGASFKNTQTIIYGPRGDGYVADMIVMRERLAQFPAIVASNLRSQEMSFGSLPRLIEIIEQTLKEYPEEVIIIAPTLASVLLKEDVETTLKRFNEQDRRRIVWPASHPFRDQEDSAAAKTLAQIIALYSKSGERSPEPSVNIIGTSLLNYNYAHDLKAIRQILEDLGIAVNLVIPLGTSIYELDKVARAWVNISADLAISALSLEYLKRYYQQPYLSMPPFGLTNTRKFIEELGELFGRDYAGYIEKKEQEIRMKWQDILKTSALLNKAVCIFGDITSTLGLSSIFRDDLNINLNFKGTFNVSCKQLIPFPLTDLREPLFISDDALAVTKKIKENKPDIILGTLNEERLANNLQIPFIRISAPMRHVTTMSYPFQSFIGYLGYDNLLFNLKELFLFS